MYSIAAASAVGMDNLGVVEGLSGVFYIKRGTRVQDLFCSCLGSIDVKNIII